MLTADPIHLGKKSPGHASRPRATGRWSVGLLLLIGLAQAWTLSGKEPQKPAELFETTKVWTLHLRFTPEQWQAMEPKQNLDRGASRGLGRLGGPGGFAAASFLKDGDKNQDEKLSQPEFQVLAQRWFAEWDREKTGSLDGEQVRTGIEATLGPRGVNLQGQAGQRNGLAAAMGIEFEYVHADLEFEGKMFKDVAVRYKGNGTYIQSRNSLKRSLKVDLNRYVQGQKLAGVTMLNLHNNVSDPSWMNEALSYRLYRDAGVPAPRTAYARVFLTVPGQYARQFAGLYAIVEDIDKHFTAERFGVKHGALFKPVTPSLFADLGNDWEKYQQTYDPKTDLTEEQTRRVMELCRLVTQAGDAEFQAKIGTFLELDEFARFMAVTAWLAALDSLLGPGQNFYVYLQPQTKQFQFLPWDLDHSFGQFALIGTQEQRENLSLRQPWRGEKRFLERVFKTAAFQQAYQARLKEFSQTIFQPKRFMQQVDEIAAAIRPAVGEESAEKLTRFDQVVAGETVAIPRPGVANAQANPRLAGRGGDQTLKPIKAFAQDRARAVASQLAGKSEGEILSGTGLVGRGGAGGRPGLARFGTAFVNALDRNADNTVARDEFKQGFARWFSVWDLNQDGLLAEEEIRMGLGSILGRAPGGMFGGRRFNN